MTVYLTMSIPFNGFPSTFTSNLCSLSMPSMCSPTKLLPILLPPSFNSLPLLHPSCSIFHPLFSAFFSCSFFHSPIRGTWGRMIPWAHKSAADGVNSDQRRYLGETISDKPSGKKYVSKRNLEEEKEVDWHIRKVRVWAPRYDGTSCGDKCGRKIEQKDV